MVQGRKWKMSEEDISKLAEDLVLVDVHGHHLHNDEVRVGDWAARNLRTWVGDQTELWKSRGKVTRPVFQKVKDDHLSRGYVNPRLMARLHDRGAELQLKQFYTKNANVTERKGKLRVDTEDGAASYSYDYVDPQSVWECMDTVHHYSTALRSVRGDLLLRGGPTVGTA